MKPLSKKWKALGSLLGIPKSRRKSIDLGSDDSNLAELINRWLSGEGCPPSWRALFWAVFGIDEDIADEIADYVEPTKGNDN